MSASPPTPAALAPPPARLSGPGFGESLREAWRYRVLLWHLVVMDLKVRYRGSALGFLWTLLNPILLMLIMYAIFGRFRPASTENYAMFLLAGVMAWTYFSSSISSSLESVLRQGALLKKLYLPKLIFPLATVLSQTLNFFFFLTAYVILTPFVGLAPTWTWLLVAPATLMLFVSSLGLGYILAALNVYFRDVSHVTQAVLRAWFYCTPVLYSLDLFGDWQWVFYLNPATYLVECLRQPLLLGVVPAWELWVVGYLFGALFLVIGHGIFKRLQHDLIYYL